MKAFKKIYLAPNIIHLKFKKRYDLTRHLLRFQEHFESPEFRGKVFSLKEFKPWYMRFHKEKKFKYYTDWNGFNFPSKILKPFLDGKFNPLSSREKAILKALDGQKGRFYVIGTFSNDDLRHEVAHALFYVNPQYRKEVLKVIGRVDTSIWEKVFENMGGYHPSVWIDEVHAYIMEDEKYLKKSLEIEKPHKFRKHANKIRAIFNRYKPKNYA